MDEVWRAFASGMVWGAILFAAFLAITNGCYEQESPERDVDPGV